MILLMLYCCSCYFWIFEKIYKRESHSYKGKPSLHEENSRGERKLEWKVTLEGCLITSTFFKFVQCATDCIRDCNRLHCSQKAKAVLKWVMQSISLSLAIDFLLFKIQNKTSDKHAIDCFISCNRLHSVEKPQTECLIIMQLIAPPLAIDCTAVWCRKISFSIFFLV